MSIKRLFINFVHQRNGDHVRCHVFEWLTTSCSNCLNPAEVRTNLLDKIEYCMPKKTTFYHQPIAFLSLNSISKALRNISSQYFHNLSENISHFYSKRYSIICTSSYIPTCTPHVPASSGYLFVYGSFCVWLFSEFSL